MRILYPASPLSPRRPDDQYADELSAAENAGFQTSLISVESLQEGNFTARPELQPGETILYRGWMLSRPEYETLAASIIQAGAQPVVTLDAYLSSHHLPNWYPRIADLTPETHIFPIDCDLAAELTQLGWPEFFIKDYVKSLKTAGGSRVAKPEDVPALVEKMRKFRGQIEGGFCVRRVEPFKPATEHRYFVIDNKPFAQNNSIPEIVHECARRHISPCYSVDVIEREDGALRIVEIGDGQVSDTVGWTAVQFAHALNEGFDLGLRPPNRT